jgi:hypothetical protein
MEMPSCLNLQALALKVRRKSDLAGEGLTIIG